MRDNMQEGFRFDCQVGTKAFFVEYDCSSHILVGFVLVSITSKHTCLAFLEHESYHQTPDEGVNQVENMDGWRFWEWLG